LKFRECVQPTNLAAALRP